MSQILRSHLHSSRFTNLQKRNVDLHGQFGDAPIIVLCSNASLYRSYVQKTKQRTAGSDNGLVHFVSKP